MAKIKRETLKKFGCHEKQVEELMRELGHEIDDAESSFDPSLFYLEIDGGTLWVRHRTQGVYVLRLDKRGVYPVTFIGHKTGLPLIGADKPKVIDK